MSSPEQEHQFPSFLDQARAVVARHPERVYATWYDVHGKATDEYTYQKLWQDAGTIAHHLRHTWNVPKGGKVVLCYNFGLHFFASFLGCLRAGVVAVLVFPPGPPLQKSLSKLVKVVEDCQPALILTDGAVSTLKRVDQLNPVSKTRSLWPTSVPYHRTDALVAKKTKKVLSFDDNCIGLNDLAFLQYTSGSTSLPKAVMVTHGNISHNVRLLGAGHRRTLPGDCQGLDYNHVGFSWLPQYHDLGLIYASISPFAEGWTMHMMSPVSFIKNPLLWMQLMSQKRIKWSVAPNFGYKLVVRRFLQAKQRGQALDLDLSCVHHFMNCAEPIGLETQQEFSDCFCKDHGLQPNWFFAGYGLAEHVVGCCFNDGHNVSRQRPEDQSRFIAVGHRDKFDKELLVKIVNPQTCQEVEDEVTGELWLSSPSKTAGYLGQPQLSQETMQGQLQGETSSTTTYLRTGDLAFFQDDLLYICGRSKDLIILQGANFYPHDFEYTAQTIEGVRPGCIAAFSPTESAEGGEEVQLVFEIRKEHEKNAEEVCLQIRDALVESMGLAPGQLVIVAIPERSICKTTSGKIQRRRTRQHLHDNLFSIVHALGKSAGTFKPESDLDNSGNTQQTIEEKPEDSTENLEGLSQEDKFDRIVAKVMGEGYNPTATWDEGGLSSMSTVELQNLLSLHFPVTLPPDFSEQYRTPNALKDLVLGPSTGAFFPVELEDLRSSTSSMWNRRLVWLPSTLLQGVGIAILFVMFSLATLPAYHFVQACGDYDLLILLPLTLPVWHLSFSLLVLLSKWLVIGKYSSTQVVVPSLYFLRWWFVDRLVELWEFFTGRFLLNTPLIWIFYRLMGVHMPYAGVEVDAFLREFDLITIEGPVSIGYGIKCRKFGPWKKQGKDDIGAPTLRFRPTRIGSGCTIRGHVALGATVGEGSCVERLSSLPEGAQVPLGVTAMGSPAYQIPEAAQPYVAPHWFGFMGLGKLVWILVELYLSASFWMLGEAAFGDAMRGLRWRYASLAQIVVMVCFSTVVGMLACIPMKWLFVGRRRPGSSTSDLQELLNWCVDYHFNVYNGLFKVVAENTVMTNLFLMALGMDIDLESKVWLFILPPSKVDLITIKRSFVSSATFDVVQNGEAQRVVIEDASIGHSLVLVGGASVRYTEVVPFSRVTGDLVGDAKKWEETHEKVYSVSRKLWVDVAVLPVTLCIAASFIPTFEFMSSNVFGTVVPGMSFPVLKLALGLVVHCLTWYVGGVLLHWALYMKEKGGKTYKSQPWSPVLFAIYMTVMSDYWEHSFLALMWGTPFFNAALVGMGARIKAPMWYFGKRFYDLPLIEINGPTIVDSSWCNGHLVVAGKIELGECVVSGVIHERSIFLANTHMAPGNGEKEHGPMIHYVSSTSTAADKEDATSDFDV